MQRTPLEALLDVARNMFPDNVAAAAVNMNILGVITFSLFFGLCLSTVGDAADPMVKLVDVSSPNAQAIPSVSNNTDSFETIHTT